MTMSKHKPQFGIHLLETLTVGMYEDARFIFREYVQNSADAIDEAVRAGTLSKDEGEIQILINEEDKKIEFLDNGTGIERRFVPTKLQDIGASDKILGDHKGFRGIGRLGGIAYCNKLVFETTFKGESEKTIFTWDAEALRTEFSSRDKKTLLEDLLEKYTSIGHEKCEPNEHYFKVTLTGINNSKLLDVESIREYISEVLPVPFDTGFIYKTEIESFIRENDFKPLDEYKIFLYHEDEQYKTRVYKPYKTYLKDNNGKSDDIMGLKFFKEEDGDGLLYWGWFALRSKYESIRMINSFRGIRLRKENIQIGDSDAMLNHWKQGRFHWYFAGEVHVVSNSLVPNGRRDYFNENKSLALFETKINSLFSDLQQLCQVASRFSSLSKDHIKLGEARKKYEAKKEEGWLSDEEEAEVALTIQTLDEGVKTKRSQLESSLAGSSLNPVAREVMEKLIDESKLETKPFVRSEKKKYITQSLPLGRKEKTILRRVFKIINLIIADEELRNQIIARIKEEFQHRE